jgi:hypothetical protein
MAQFEPIMSAHITLRLTSIVKNGVDSALIFGHPIRVNPHQSRLLSGIALATVGSGNHNNWEV